MRAQSIQFGNLISNRRDRPAGFTIVEILVVIAIMMVLVAILVPSLRFLTRDRTIREAGRVAGSVFVEARNRAQIDGSAGVLIRRLGTDVQRRNRAIELFQMRTPPPYSGLTMDDRAVVTGSTATITPPPPAEVGISPFDLITFGEMGGTYRIISAVDGTIEFAVDPVSQPLPPQNQPLRFNIIRQPRPVVATRIEMPTRTFLDLTWSGYLVPGDPNSDDHQFGRAPNDPQGPLNDDVAIFFNRSGAIERIVYWALDPNTNDYTVSSVPPPGPVFILVSTWVRRDNEQDILAFADSETQWIRLDHRSGAVSVAPAADPGDENAPVKAQLANSRQLTGHQATGRQ